jgi:hypothetical protein
MSDTGARPAEFLVDPSRNLTTSYYVRTRPAAVLEFEKTLR